jgi:hypothetical protein
MTHPLIASALAAPMTHKVVTTYADGRVREHLTRNAAAAETFAFIASRKIGRRLIDRATGATVRVVSVEIVKI